MTVSLPVNGVGGPPAPGRPGSAMSTVAVLVIAIVALYVGRDILIPFALAVLLSFALGPIATRFRRWGLGRIPSVLAVTAVAFLALGGFAVLVGSQVIQLASNLPTYQYNIRAKIQSVQSASPSGGVVDRTLDVLHDLGDELSAETAEAPAAGEAPERDPVPVVIESPTPSPLEVIQNIAGPLLAPVGTAGLVIVFVVLMLLEREDLRDRLIRLVGGGNLSVTTEALDEAGKRVSRYLLMQLIVNATYGLPVGLGLWLIGVPNALLWGVLATVLRFIPYVGPFIAALFPIALSIAVDRGWSMLAWTIALFLVIELISNNFVEPWLYGASTGISAIAIILAAIVWTTLWGPVGLILSTPLTVCLVVMGRYIPQLRFLDVLLGSAPVLAPEERLYQRMLAGDPEEGEEIAHAFLKNRPLVAFYDEVALPALRLAELDRLRKVLAGERRAVVTESFLRVVGELADHEDPDPAADDAAAGAAAEAPVPWTGKTVLCIAGRTGLDRVGAAMLAQLLEHRGIPARALPADAIAPEAIAGLDPATEIVCLSYLGASAVAQGRQACRRLRRRLPKARILVGLWGGQGGREKAEDAAAGLSADGVARSLAEAVAEIERLGRTPAAAVVPPPIPSSEPERLAELRRLGLLDTPPEEAFDRITRRLAQAFGAPIALLSLVDERREFWKAATGLPEDLAAAREAPREVSVCGHVVAKEDVLVIEDVLKDERFADNPFLRERGIRFYAGAPLRTAAGHVIGALCVIDTEPRRVSPRERALLQLVADEVMAEIERRGGPAAVGDALAGRPAPGVAEAVVESPAPVPAGTGDAAPATVAPRPARRRARKGSA